MKQAMTNFDLKQAFDCSQGSRQFHSTWNTMVGKWVVQAIATVVQALVEDIAELDGRYKAPSGGTERANNFETLRESGNVEVSGLRPQAHISKECGEGAFHVLNYCNGHCHCSALQRYPLYRKILPSLCGNIGSTQNNCNRIMTWCCETI